MADLHHRPRSTPKRRKPLILLTIVGSVPNPILLAQTAICPESRPQLPRLRLPRRNPPPRTASRTPARLSAPFRTLSRFSARVVLALRATTKRGASDAPGELASISVAAAFSCLFVSRVGELSCPAREAATKVAMRCDARGETQSQAPGRRRASRLRSNPPRRGRRSWSRGAPLSPRGRAVNRSSVRKRHRLWQLALSGQVSGNILVI